MRPTSLQTAKLLAGLDSNVVYAELCKLGGVVNITTLRYSLTGIAERGRSRDGRIHNDMIDIYLRQLVKKGCIVRLAIGDYQVCAPLPERTVYVLKEARDGRLLTVQKVI